MEKLGPVRGNILRYLMRGPFGASKYLQVSAILHASRDTYIFLASGGRWSTTTHHEAQTIRIAESSHHHVQQKHLLSIGDKGCTLRMLVDGMALGEKKGDSVLLCVRLRKK